MTFFIVVPTAATSATLDPEMPDMMYIETTITCSMPPRNRPTSDMTKSVSLRLRPPSVIT